MLTAPFSAPILLVITVTLGASLLGVRRLRAKEAIRTGAGASPDPESDAPQGHANAEDCTVTLTLLATFVVWPVAWMLDNFRRELLGGARPELLILYICVALLPLLGGALGWLRAKRRRLDGLAVWRYTAWGVLFAGLAILLAVLALAILIARALAHSHWQF